MTYRMTDLEPDGAPRMNVPWDCPKVECHELARTVAYQRAAIIELTENYNRLCAAVAMQLADMEGRYIVLADDLSLLAIEDGLLEQDDLLIYDRAVPL